MTIENGKLTFGFFEGTPYGDPTDEYEDFLSFKNDIDKKKVIKHIEALGDWLASEMCTDMFTGEKFNVGVYHDGPFTFSVDFFRYYKTQDIGIPYEYEAYLKTILD